MNLLIATTAAFALLISTVSAGAVRYFFSHFPFQQLYNPNLIIIVTNFLLLQSCTKPFGSGYCHDDQTGDMLRCSTVCIHFSCPPLYTYLTCSTLLYSIDRVCVLWILHFFSLSSFPLPFCSRRDFEWNTNNDLFCFLICF